MVLVTLLATLASACTRERYDWHAPAIEAARDHVVPPARAAVTAVVAGLDPYGAAERDDCHVGQDNFKVREEYRTRCFVVIRSVAGLDGQELEFAIDEARAQLAAAGCTGEPPPAQPPALWGGLFQCGSVEIVVEVGAVLDNRFRDRVGQRVPGPCCAAGAEQTFDPVDAFVGANLAGHRYLLVATASAEYYAECRDGRTVTTIRECPPVQ
jgi:hypothetical protein